MHILWNQILKKYEIGLFVDGDKWRRRSKYGVNGGGDGDEF